MKPPSKIVIGTHTFEVTPNPLLKVMDRALGVTDGGRLKIEYVPQTKDSVTRDMLVHEVLHAIWWASGLVSDEDADYEEQVIGTITPWLLSVIDNNPAFKRILINE